MALKLKDLDDTQAPLLDHLIELRKRLVRAVAALAVAFGVCFYFADRIFGFLVLPLTRAFPAGQGQLIYTRLYEAFFVEIKVALFAAFFLAFPIIANQLWAFVAPGLYAREKRAFLPFLIATPILFTLGGSLAYFVVMPLAFTWFLGFQGEAGGLQAQALPAMGDYLDLVMRFILAFGVSFLLPVLLMLLNRAGLVSRAQLVAARRYVIVAVFAVAAIITPPDPVTQIMLATPLLLLFEGSLVLMRFSEKRDLQAKTRRRNRRGAGNGGRNEAGRGPSRITAVELHCVNSIPGQLEKPTRTSTKKRGHSGPRFQNSMLRISSRAGRQVRFVGIVASGDDDAGDDHSCCEQSEDETTALAFKLFALHFHRSGQAINGRFLREHRCCGERDSGGGSGKCLGDHRILIL